MVENIDYGSFKSFYESIGKEFETVKDRVRNLIGDANWSEDGSHKERILKNYLKKILPEYFAVGTGFFVQSFNHPTHGPMSIQSSQIDIIIYDKKYPVLLKDGDFVIIPIQSVRAIIEVKTNIIDKSNYMTLNETIDKMNRNGLLLYNFHYNSKIRTDQSYQEISFQLNKLPIIGIFSFEIQNTSRNIYNAIKNAINSSYFNPTYLNERTRSTSKFLVNLLSIGNHLFFRNDEWDFQVTYENQFKLYEFKEKLAPAYFIGNLIMTLRRYLTDDGEVEYFEIMNLLPRNKRDDEIVGSFGYDTNIHPEAREYTKNALEKWIKNSVHNVLPNTMRKADKERICDEIVNYHFQLDQINELSDELTNYYEKSLKDPYFIIYNNFYRRLLSISARS
ncbi:MAG: hypothetical protein INQ03_23845 [Candidatus Heimdallarchaeota archaeon]|nr:hypothetical protein [Candidatus Heimdallarchaeota archaeon]